MPDQTPAAAARDIAATLEEVLVALGAGIGRSQAELDRHSIEIQKLIAEDPVLSQYGAEPTWYQIPTAELELKIAVTIEETPAPPAPSVATPAATATPTSTLPTGGSTLTTKGLLPGPLKRLFVQPINAKYTNQFGFSFQAASTIKLTIVPVPAPGAPPAATRNEAEVLAAAEQYLAKGPDGKPQPRVTVNYNPGARAWYVVQTAEDKDPIEMRALVKVDDETGNVLKHVSA
jgi:hypothetical protein